MDKFDYNRALTRNTGRYKRLDPKTERELFDRVAEGDKVAITRLVIGYTWLVNQCVHKFANPAAGLEFEDLAQEGKIALIKAVNKFTSNRGSSFERFARRLI